MLERVLDGDFEGSEAWEFTDGVYRRELEDVTLFFDPSNSRLTVEARLSEMVSAEARAIEEVSGVTIGEVAVDGIGNYYHDGWGGRTKDRAVEDAQADADNKMKDAVKALHLDQHGDKLDEAREKAKAQAQSLAQEELEQNRNVARQALRTHLQSVLHDARDRVHHIINRAVGEAYRQTLLRLVRENGGRVLADETTGSVMNLELVLP